MHVPAGAAESAAAGSAGVAAAGGGDLQRVKKLHGKLNMAQRIAIYSALALVPGISRCISGRRVG